MDGNNLNNERHQLGDIGKTVEVRFFVVAEFFFMTTNVMTTTRSSSKKASAGFGSSRLQHLKDNPPKYLNFQDALLLFSSIYIGQNIAYDISDFQKLSLKDPISLKRLGTHLTNI